MEEDFGRKELRSPKIATEELDTTGIFTTKHPSPAFVPGHLVAPTAKSLLAVRLLLSSSHFESSIPNLIPAILCQEPQV
jgi:hypothetical protein